MGMRGHSSTEGQLTDWLFQDVNHSICLQESRDILSIRRGCMRQIKESMKWLVRTFQKTVELGQKKIPMNIIHPQGTLACLLHVYA